MKDIVIGITDCGSFTNYEKWILKEPGVSVIRLSQKLKNFDEIAKCDGVVLSGGEDIHPRYYNREDYVELCGTIDEERDDFEWRVLEYTVNNALPLLGICRGLQVANVFFGGTLIPDIPAFGKYNHSKFPDEDRYHEITVDKDSLLGKIAGVHGEVNSAHHQSADRIGGELVANCFSPDGIIEGIERKDPASGPYLMLVQWHPERMRDQLSPFSEKLKRSFIDAVRRSE